jgi:ABC-type amino acid transport substrate-binding protein
MLDPIVKFFDHMSSLWKLRDALVALCQSNPVVAGAIIFFLLIVLVYLIVTNAANLALKAYSWLQHPASAAGVVLGLIVAGVVSTGMVLSIRMTAAPVPVFNVDKDTFVGEQLHLKWKYDQQGTKKKDVTVFYELESAADSNFQIDVRREPDYADGERKYLRNINASRYWRVRAVDSQTHQPISDWSRGETELTQYDSAYKRIEKTGTVLIYVTSVENEDIFKWLDKTFQGFDIKLANAIVASLSNRIGSGPLRVKFIPHPWPELLKMPSQGRADMIISSISKLKEREQLHNLKFSETYFCTTQALVFPAGSPEQSIADMIRGKRVGFHEETTSDRVAKELNKDIPFDAKAYRRVDGMIDALLSSDLDIGITDAPFAAGNRQVHQPRLEMKLLSSKDFPSSIPNERFDEYAVAVRSSEDALLRAISEAIAQLKTSGGLHQMVVSATSEYETAKGLAKGALGAPPARPWECP